MIRDLHFQSVRMIGLLCFAGAALHPQTAQAVCSDRDGQKEACTTTPPYESSFRFYKCVWNKQNSTCEERLTVDPTSRVLRVGDSGKDVLTSQKALRKKGYDDVPLNGIFEDKTEKAVKELQRNGGLKDNGVIRGETRRRLFAPE